MPKKPEHTFRELRFGRELACLRQRAGLDHADAAIRRGGRQFWVSRPENAKVEGWWSPYDVEQQRYLGLEDEACTVTEWQLAQLPPLLRTEEYVRARLAGSCVPRTPEQVDNEVEVQVLRRRRLTGAHPLRCHAIIDESVLSARLPEALAAGQLRHVLTMAELPNVTVQIVPDTVGLHVGTKGAFTLFGFPEPQDPDVLYIGHVVGSLDTDRVGAVARIRRTFARIEALALSPAESVEWIAALLAKRGSS
ncbi:hypothetical protein F0L68_23410 [Solihabitans fulvus]|uniref:DUF5753 domain-containing protein n=1 Tax=Solihabitans fulvus TaxID=1892852 RepID=A0A5B2X5X7_9PSEU|nr:DUF5753 domain-containing protein [Solihabitans fulvus]KAA2258778.1 hypothetical protein F0L68_23410 [Solihabitans fulvus]